MQAAQFGLVSEKFSTYDVVLEPDKNVPEWWAGAPSVLRDEDGVFWLAARMRTADAPRGLRGYEIRIMRSDDGIHFKKVHEILRENVPVRGFERPALLKDPDTGRYKLYGCCPNDNDEWCIIKFDDADSPDQFIADTAKTVIQPMPRKDERDVRPDGYKDPVILYADGAYHCYVIGIMRRTERIYHFTSPDGESWEAVGNPYESIMHLEGWHDFYVRPAAIVPQGVGYLFIYEGSNVKDYDPVYNINTGLAYTFDLHHIHDITPDAPLLTSTTPSERLHTWRYSQWLDMGNEWWIYAEVVRPNETNEIRLFRIAKQG